MRMGFEDKLRVVRVMNNKLVSAMVGGKMYNFKSILEYKWAQYLELQKKGNIIIDWQYEPVKLDFWEFGYRNKPYQYTPDFLVMEIGGGLVFHECKGYLETKDISRISRANKHYDNVFDLVMQRIPKKGRGLSILARARGYQYIRRVIDASEIFKQCKGLLK